MKPLLQATYRGVIFPKDIKDIKRKNAYPALRAGMLLFFQKSYKKKLYLRLGRVDTYIKDINKMNYDYDTAKSQLKDQLETYLINKGINIKKPFNCLNPAHADKNPSMSYDKKRNKVHCFSCNADYDIIDLIQIDYNITDTAEAFKKGYELFNISCPDIAQKQPKSEQNKKYTHNTDNTDNKHNDYMTKPEADKPDLKKYFETCNKAIAQTSYLKDRGISEALINAFNIGYDNNFYFVNNEKGNFNAPAVIIPTGEKSYIARCTDNNKPSRYNKRGPSLLFNIQACKQPEAVFIVEGEIDALSIIEAGYNAVALGSTSNTDKFLDYLEANITECTFILALDNDKAGQDAEEKLITGLKRLEKKYYKTNVYDTLKDANEALLKDKQCFMTSLAEAVEEAKNPEEAQRKKELEDYKKDYAKENIKDFLDGIREKANTPFIPTGFNKLDEQLDGGLFEGLYFIGAISSLGKTTFTLQMADQIAQQGQDVIIFSLEMAKTELMAKSISRQTLLNSSDMKKAKTTRGITTYSRYLKYSKEEITLINDAVKAYSTYADKIVIYEGMGDVKTENIREAVEKHIRLTGNRPVVIIDYLQIIAPFNDRATDKQNTDKAVIELKRISRDFKVSVIAISSINRDNYKNKISMLAFKESGAIEYSSDVLIGLQFKGQGENNFDADEAKQKSNKADSPRDIELVILKNRNGRTGEKIDYRYYPYFNYFKEAE